MSRVHRWRSGRFLSPVHPERVQPSLNVDETPERLLDLRPGDVLVDVDLLEEGLVEEPPPVIRGLQVHLLGIAQEVESGVKEFGTGVDLLVGVSKLLPEFLALLLDAVDALADLALRQLAVGGQVEQVLFLDVELGQGAFELVVKQLGGLILVGQRLVKQRPHLIPEGGVELDVAVVAQHSVLDDIEIPVGLGTEVLLLGAAEEVEVDAATALGSLDEHAGFATVLEMAAGAPDRALEVVVVLVLAFAGGGAGGQDLLHTIEHVRDDEGLVAAVVLDAAMGDVAKVIAVAQDERQAAVGHGAAGVAAVGSGAEAAVGQGVAEPLQGVFVGSEQLEGEADE